jgi:hypothetical protein
MAGCGDRDRQEPVILPAPGPLSLTAYAKRRGVSPVAVSKAVAAGRLSASVTRDDRGAPKIADPELADREWTANTRPRIDHPPAAPRAPVADREPSPEPPPPPDRPRLAPVSAPALDDVPDYNESRARREAAAARKEVAHADIAEMDRDERRGELVSVAEARADVIDRFAIVRTRLLGIPSRVAQRMPHVAGEVVPVLDDLLREALEELADEGGST